MTTVTHSVQNKRDAGTPGINGNPGIAGAATALARERLHAEGGAFLRCDWSPALFVHFQADADALRRVTPFELDLYEGRAFVSLVAFAMHRVSIAGTGGLCDRVTAHADSLFLNVRTYVRHAGEPAIYFMHEWLDSAVQALLGPRTYGLPYHKAQLTLTADDALHACESRVTLRLGGATPSTSLLMRALRDPDGDFAPATPDTLEHFLVERYTALTHRGGVSRRFRVTHEPWRIAPAACSIDEVDLLGTIPPLNTILQPALPGAGPGEIPGNIPGAAFRPIAAHLTHGVNNVEIGRPSCVNGPACLRVWSDILPAPY